MLYHWWDPEIIPYLDAFNLVNNSVSYFIPRDFLLFICPLFIILEILLCAGNRRVQIALAHKEKIQRLIVIPALEFRVALLLRRNSIILWTYQMG